MSKLEYSDEQIGAMVRRLPEIEKSIVDFQLSVEGHQRKLKEIYALGQDLTKLAESDWHAELNSLLSLKDNLLMIEKLKMEQFEIITELKTFGFTPTSGKPFWKDSKLVKVYFNDGNYVIETYNTPILKVEILQEDNDAD